MWWRNVSFIQDSNQRPSGKRARVSLLNCVYIRLSKYLYNIPLKFWPFYYQWKWMKSKEHDQTRVPKPLPAEIKRWRLQEWFSNISVQLNFTETKTQFAEIFHTDIHETQIFKIRRFRSTLKGTRTGVSPLLRSARGSAKRCMLPEVELFWTAVCVPLLLRRNGNGTWRKLWGLWTELWEREGSRESLSMKKIAGESEKVFARILDESFKCSDLPKISVFSRRTIQNFKTLTPPLVFWN